MSENKLFQNILIGVITASTFLTPNINAEARSKQKPQQTERISTKVKEKLNKIDTSPCLNHPIKCTKNKIKKFRQKHNL